MGYLIGLDIGTQGAKGLLIDRSGKQVGSSYSGYDVLQPKPLWAEQWPEVWVEGVCKTLRSLLETASVDAGHVVAIAISGLYGGSGEDLMEVVNDFMQERLAWFKGKQARFFSP
jgi:ribulokinase